MWSKRVLIFKVSAVLLTTEVPRRSSFHGGSREASPSTLIPIIMTTIITIIHYKEEDSSKLRQERPRGAPSKRI